MKQIFEGQRNSVENKNSDVDLTNGREHFPFQGLHAAHVRIRLSSCLFFDIEKCIILLL